MAVDNMKNFYILLTHYKLGPYLMEGVDIANLIERLNKMDKETPDAEARIQFAAFDGPNPFYAFVCFNLLDYVGYAVDHK
jgi:hypothetical protein